MNIFGFTYMKGNDIMALCSNFREVTTELGLSDEDIADGKALRRRLRLTYPIDRENDTDTFSLVRDLERKGCYTPIDDGLLDIVLHLNRIGIRTLYCCEGHVTNTHPAPFWGNLMYETPNTVPEKLTEAIGSLNRRKGFEIVHDCVCGTERTNIRWCFHTPEEKGERLQILREKLLAL